MERRVETWETVVLPKTSPTPKDSSGAPLESTSGERSKERSDLLCVRDTRYLSGEPSGSVKEHSCLHADSTLYERGVFFCRVGLPYRAGLQADYVAGTLLRRRLGLVDTNLLGPGVVVPTSHGSRR